MTYSFQLDPCEILGIEPTATLLEIRDAYRAKSKKHHPDLGGDEWSFRVLTKAHEIMSTARIAGRISAESSAAQKPPPPRSEPKPNPFGKIDPRRGAAGDEQVRTSRDASVTPERLVAVELLVLRFEVDDPITFLAESPEHRNLSCCLNITWPVRSLANAAESLDEAAATLESLRVAFDETTTASRVIAARSRIEAGRFAGWLTYSSVQRAEDGFKALQAALARRGLGVQRTVREVTVPREWQE